MSRETPFELLGFGAVATGAEAALIELEGAFPGGHPPPPSATRLLIEGRDGSRQELSAATAGGPADHWRASFAAPLSALEGASFALIARRVVVELPRPDATAPDAERLVRSVREVNALRRRLEAMEAEVAEARALRAAADALREERDALREDLARAAEDAEREHAEGAERLAAAEAARAQAEESLALAGSEADERVAVAQQAAEERARLGERSAEELAEQLETARRELAHEREGAEMTVRALREALDAAHDETRDVRRHLKHVRAELEALRREHGRPHRPSGGESLVPPGDDGGESVEGVRVLGPVRRADREPDDEAEPQATTVTEVHAGEEPALGDSNGSEDPATLWARPGEAPTTVHRGDEDPGRPGTTSMFAEPRPRRAVAEPQHLPPVAISSTHAAPNAARWLVVALLAVGVIAFLAILFGLLPL